MIENELIEFFIGNTYTRDITISNYTSPISNIFFSVKKNNNDKRTVLQKKLNNGITLVDIQYDEDNNIISRTYNLTIDADETEKLKADFDYYFDVKIITPDIENNIEKTIITGTFKVKNTTTRQYNES